MLRRKNILSYFHDEIDDEMVYDYEYVKNEIKKELTNVALHNLVDLEIIEDIADILKNEIKISNIYRTQNVIKYLTENGNVDRLIKLLKILLEKTDIDDKKIIQYMKDENFIPSKDQKKGIRRITRFLKSDKKTFGFYGYAGSGKTTSLVNYVYVLIKNELIKSVVFAAPTHKALNVMENKMGEMIDKLLRDNKIQIENRFNEKLKSLSEIGIDIKFYTIHKLFRYRHYYNDDGELNFKYSGKKSYIYNHDITLIDECSMISFGTLMDIKSELNRKNSDLNLPKIIFCGDPAQMPPVNETSSYIFNDKSIVNKDYRKIQYNEYVKEIGLLEKALEMSELDEIIEQDTVTLRKVMRNKDNTVVLFCKEFRDWVFEKKDYPDLPKYIGNLVRIYNSKNGENGLESNWLKRAMRKFKNNNSLVITCILTWTNKQCNMYNDIIRKHLFKKTIIDKYEIGDVLVFNNYYNMYEGKKDVKDVTNFYTSDQIKVTYVEDNISYNISGIDMEIIKKIIEEFKLEEEIKKNLYNVCNKKIEEINRNTGGELKMWKLSVQKLNEIIEKDYIPKTSIIYVINDEYNNKLENDKEYCVKNIKLLKELLLLKYPRLIKIISDELIPKIWMEYNKIFVEPFANVNYSYSQTVHKSQGSTYCNIYIDAIDINKNQNNDEAKRCMYTAVTRASNEVCLLL